MIIKEIKDVYDFMWHRDNDLPALIYSNGSQVWWQHNKRHRDNDKPAVIGFNGDQSWYQHGKFIKWK